MKRLAAFGLNFCDKLLSKFSPFGGEDMYKAAIAARKEGADYLVIDYNSICGQEDWPLAPRTREFSSVKGPWSQMSPPGDFYVEEGDPYHSGREVMDLRKKPFGRFMDVNEANRRFAAAVTVAPL